MSKPVVYYWAPSLGPGYGNGIAVNQDVALGDSFLLNANRSDGSFAYVETLNINTTCNDTKAEVIRSIAFTSTTATSNAGVTFVIEGIGCEIDANGNPTTLLGPITEERVGPAGNASTLSQRIYTVINSITVRNNPGDQPAVDVEVGFGSDGITSYCLLDLNRATPMGVGATYTHQFLPSPATDLESTVYVSLNKVEVPNIHGYLDPFGLINGTQVTFINALEYDAATSASNYKAITTPFQLIWANIKSNVLTTESLLFTVAQQGIT